MGGVLLQGCHREGGPSGVGEGVIVEGQQTSRLGDPLGGHLGGRPGGGLQVRLESIGSSRVAGASGVVTGMHTGEGWVVVSSKYEEQPRSTPTGMSQARLLCMERTAWW